MKKILVIEDDRSLRDSILELLSAEGFETIGAKNGYVGITSACKHQPDLIICDLMMPELNGYQTLNLVRKQPITATIPFIFITGKADKSYFRQAMELGADDYLTKPFTKTELLKAIAARLKRQEAVAQQMKKLFAPVHRSIYAQTEYHDNNTLANQFAALKNAKFTGRLLIHSSEQEWKIYLCHGQILYATGGIHPVRRWQRNLFVCCPQIQGNQLNLPSAEFASSAWEYLLLGLWLKQKQISQEQVTQMIRDSVTEVLFDIMQAGEKRYQAQPENSLPLQLLLIDVEQAFTTAQNLWQSWQAANLTHISPNNSPMLKRPELLQQQTSTLTYQKLSALLDGQCTLRDLAVQMKRLVCDITPSLLTYIQAGIVELVDIPDLPEPKFSALPATPIQSALLKPVIACIDDSPIICQTLEYIITQAGYQCLAIQDPLRAISTLLSSKPDLIFLDLVMPNVNGYEICTSLRKLSAFHDTPIVILSGNIIDRVRARVVGASDCLDKPVNSEAVLKLISKYLSPMLSGGRLGVNS